MAVRGQDIASVIKRQIEEFGQDLTMTDVGVVVEVGDGIARIHGLSGVGSTELLEFEGGTIGMALNLEEDGVGAVILGDPLSVQEGTEVRSTGRVAELPVGKEFLGRVVDPLGRPIDGKGPIKSTKTRPAEIVAPGVAARQSVTVPVQTGIKAIDAMVAIGRGQRELIIGDRGIGKTTLATDTIINQKGGDLFCVYVAIGQKIGKVAQTVALLEANGAMEHTIVVSASASDPAPLQFLAPYAGCAMGEYFRDKGQHALVIYDDLSKHADSYGFPDWHPPMEALLGVQIANSAGLRANLYLANSPGEPGFTVEDERQLTQLTHFAQLALDSATLYERERENRLLAESAERRLQAVIEESTVGVVIVEAGSRKLLRSSQEARRILDHSLDIGMPLDDINRLMTLYDSDGRLVTTSELPLEVALSSR